ncbi:hypothetical protein ACJMK2_038720 [Sinanodonta woodiana]|uniref:Uncharacterized protein n=1 Tax=Sinanodonta woodiana TaxID=1069815 RepID=A0ABD3WAX6_SINWO
MATVADSPIGNCDLVTVAALTLEGEKSSRHLYPGIVHLPGQRMLLADFSVNKVNLYNRQTGDILAKSEELYPLWDVCSVDENRSNIAVALRNGAVQIMSIIANTQSPHLKSLKVLTTSFDSCRGVSSIPKQNRLVVCGMYRTMQCWCLLSISDGKCGKRHEICENGGYGCSYVAASESGKCVYISCFADKSIDTGVYGYVAKTGELTFIYRRKDLSWPRGICADKRGFIYVCNQHLDNRNIHQLTENGEPVMIFRLEIPPDPQGMCFDQNQEQIFISLWGKNQIWSLRMVWRGHEETTKSHEVRVRTAERRKPPAQDRGIHGSKESVIQAEKSTAEAFTLGCFGCFGTRVSQNKRKAKEHYKKEFDKDGHECKDQEMTAPSDNDSQAASLEAGEPLHHDVHNDVNEPVSLVEDVTPGKAPNQSGLEKNEAPQGAKSEIKETPKQRPRQVTPESSDAEADSSNRDSGPSESSNDSPDDRTKGKHARKKSATTLVGTSSGIVSIEGPSKSNVVQINILGNATETKTRKKKKSRSYDKE